MKTVNKKLGAMNKDAIERVLQLVKEAPTTPSVSLAEVDRILADQGLVRVSADDDPFIRWSTPLLAHLADPGDP